MFVMPSNATFLTSSFSPMDCSFIKADLRSLEKELKYNDQDIVNKNSGSLLRKAKSEHIWNDSKILPLRSIGDSSSMHNKLPMKAQVRTDLLF